MRALIAVIIILFISGCSEKSDRASNEIEEAIMILVKDNPDIGFIKIFETTKNNYVVELLVPDTMEVTKDTNSRDQNLILTKRWGALVCTPELNSVAVRFNIGFLSVRQIDKNGNLHSIALCG